MDTHCVENTGERMNTACCEGRMDTACCEGRMDIIDSLLDSGIDVNTPFGRILPLHQACNQTEPWALDLVTKLITHGADVDLEDSVGWNAMDSALTAVPFQPYVAQLVLDCSKKGVNRLGEDYTNYLWTTSSVEAIKFLVENGIDINHVADDCAYLDCVSGKPFDYLRSVGAKLFSEL